MKSIKVVALVVTGLWLLSVVLVGLLWMGQEYALIEKDNGDGTVTFRDGPDKATSTEGEFFAVAVKNSLIVVLFFPTLPYAVVMFVIGIVWLVTRNKDQPVQDQGWGASADGTTMAERLARTRDVPRD